MNAREAAVEYLIAKLEHNDLYDIHEFVSEEIYDHELESEEVRVHVDALSWKLRYHLKEGF